MERKKFLLTALVATPLAALSNFFNAGYQIKKPFKIDAGKSRFNEVFTFRAKNTQVIKVAKSDTDNLLSVFEYVGKEKVGPPLHVHFEQDEIFFVVQGMYRFVCGNEEYIMKSGDTIFLPRNIPHTWVQLSDEGKMIYMLQPSGSFEDFLREIQAFTQPPSEEMLQQVHIKHGMKVLGPPLNA